MRCHKYADAKNLEKASLSLYICIHRGHAIRVAFVVGTTFSRQGWSGA